MHRIGSTVIKQDYIVRNYGVRSQYNIRKHNQIAKGMFVHSRRSHHGLSALGSVHRF
jgi:hypothetical protein